MYTKLLKTEEVAQIDEEWVIATTKSIKESNELYAQLQIPCEVFLPLGEILNPNLAGYAWVWKLKQCVHPEDITDKHRFNANGLEGCFRLNMMLSSAILLYRETTPDRINIFVSPRFRWPYQDNQTK